MQLQKDAELSKGDRTIDRMVLDIRSGKQNIFEGYAVCFSVSWRNWNGIFIENGGFSEKMAALRKKQRGY